MGQEGDKSIKDIWTQERRGPEPCFFGRDAGKQVVGDVCVVCLDSGTRGAKEGNGDRYISVNGVSHEEKGYFSCQSVWERINPGAGKEGMGGLSLVSFWGLTPGR